MWMPPFVPSSRIGAPPPFNRPSSRRRDDSVVSMDSRSALIPPLVIEAEIEAFESAGSRRRMPPFVHSSFAPPSANARELHFNAAVGGARLDPARNIARADAAVGRFGDHAPGEAGNLDAAVDCRELRLGSNRDTHGIFHLRVAHLEPAAAPRQLRLDTDARRRDVLADFDALERFLGGRRVGALGALAGDDLDARPGRRLDFNLAVDVADLHASARRELVGLAPFSSLTVFELGGDDVTALERDEADEQSGSSDRRMERALRAEWQWQSSDVVIRLDASEVQGSIQGSGFKFRVQFSRVP